MFNFFGGLKMSAMCFVALALFGIALYRQGEIIQPFATLCVAGQLVIGMMTGILQHKYAGK